MAKSAPDKVLLRGEPNRFEREAAGVIDPGDLLVLGSDDTVTAHSTVRGHHIGWFAVENDIAGDDFDHDYASGEVVQIHSAKPGDVINCHLANGEDAAIGAILASSGTTGALSVEVDSAAIPEGAIVGIALTAVDMSDSDAADPSDRIQVLIT